MGIPNCGYRLIMDNIIGITDTMLIIILIGPYTYILSLQALSS